MRRWSLFILTTLFGLLIPDAQAGGWETGEVELLAEGTYTDVVVSTLDDGPALLALGTTRSTLWTFAGEVELPFGGRQAQLADLVGTEAKELVLCGSQGVVLYASTSDGFRDQKVLSSLPCEAMEVLGRTVIAQLPTGMVAIEDYEAPSPRLLAPSPHARGIAVSKGVAAVLDEVLFIREHGEVVLSPVPENTLGFTRDGEGWMLAVGGASPYIQTAEGALIAVPDAPLGLTGGHLTGPEDVIAAVGESLFFRAGGDGFQTQPIGRALQTLSVGDLDEDGCADVAGIAKEGVVVVHGVCAPSSEPLASTESLALPEDVPQLVLGDAWASVTVQEGEQLQLHLVDSSGSSASFHLQDGPQGMSLSIDGDLRYTPTSQEVGTSRVSIRMRTDDGERFSGLVVKVTPDPTRETSAMTVRSPTPLPRRAASGPFVVRSCFASVGVEAGASANRRTDWASVGLPDTVPSVSPAATVACSGGGERLQWFVGADSAPSFFYLGTAGRMTHLIGGTLGFDLGSKKVRVGPFVNMGLLFFGVGLRAQLLPFETAHGGQHGLELRATTYPDGLAGSGFVGYTVEFGEH